MRQQVLAVALMAFCSAAASASEVVYELRVPIGWGDLADSDFCTRVNIAGQSGCDIGPVQLSDDISVDATYLKSRGSLEEIERLGDFSPFPWSDQTRLTLDRVRKGGIVPDDMDVSVKACTVVLVAPGCTCIDLPAGGMQILCNQDGRGLLPITVPPVPHGQLRSVR